MQFVTIASTGDMVDAGDLTTQTAEADTYGSPTRGFVATLGSPANKAIDFFNFASTGNAQEFGELLVVAGSGTGFSNGIRGIVAGGSPHLADIQAVNMVTLGDAANFGDLTAGRSMLGGTSDCIRGVMIGGYISPGANTAAIDYINIATFGNAADFGDQATTARNADATSSGHGGLG